MPRSSLRRPALALALIAIAGLAATWAYRVESAKSPSAVVVPGIVRETEIQIAPEIGGRLETVLVTTGQRVKKGDGLAVLSSPALSASLAEANATAAKAVAERTHLYAGPRKEEVEIAARNVEIAQSNLELAQQQHARAMTLASKSFLAKQKLDEAVGALSKAQSSLTLQRAIYERSTAGPTAEERVSADAKVTLAEASAALVGAKVAKTRLVAPVDGGVRLIVASPGEVVSPGQAIMTLEAGRERWFSFTLREDRLGSLRIGAPVSLRDAKGNRIDARVTELRALGEFATWRAARAVGDHDINSFFLRADPVSDTGALEPGMTVWMDLRGG
jgi:multidrug resistance efflux pump